MTARRPRRIATPAEAIENLADGFMGALCCPPGAVIDADLLAALRQGFTGLLRLARLPIPDDDFLNELLLEMAEWHDHPTMRKPAP